MARPPAVEHPFEYQSPDGAVLRGHVGGTGAPALLLHGGPGFADYTQGCAAELGDLFSTLRYTQRGREPSTAVGPYTIEQHMADALGVLDAFEVEKAWAIGHSWGGHLALHLAVSHPGRLLGIICIDTLGASDDVLPDFRAKLVERLSDEERARAQELEERADAKEATDEELAERWALLWPGYFFDPAKAPPPLPPSSVEASAGGWESMAEHFEAKTLERKLPRVRGLPALFVHGLQDPMPLRASLDTAKLIRRAKVARVPQCGHFPWIEQPGFTNRALRGLFAQL